MNKWLNYTIIFLLFFPTFSLLAQNKINENSRFQRSIDFSAAIDKTAAINLFAKGYGLDEANTFSQKTASVDDKGVIHQRHQQYYKGLLVEFGSLITHTKNNKVISVNGELYNPKSISLTPALNAGTGFQFAVNAIGAKKYLWEDPEQAAIVNYSKPAGDLLLFPLVKTGEIKLAYKYDIYSTDPIARVEVYVDANDGVILYKNPIIKHANNLISKDQTEQYSKQLEMVVSGNAATKYSGSRSIETTFDATSNKFILSDITRGKGIVTYNCERVPRAYKNLHFTDNDNNWTTAEHANAFLDDAALDAHWGAEKTYDFWKNIFNRKSFDDNDALIRSYIHYRETEGVGYPNAFWNGAFMTYGDGTTSKPLTSIDICGHEIGHAVCSYTANLAYQNQSGALNEGLSDIWGACIEHYGRTSSLSGTPNSNVWKIGEDITTNALRSMSNPNIKGHPDTFQGTYWRATGDEGSCVPGGGNDYCGVHSNSGVLNHWFYMVTVGKSGTNNAPTPSAYNITGIGMEKSSQIVYLAERDYLTPNATYFDMREATIAVAKSLYCTNSPETIAITNAWAAVNVGGNFVSYNDDIVLKTVASTTSVSCSGTNLLPVLTFENEGVNAISSVNITYKIDGGANQNLVWNGNLAPCSGTNYQFPVNISGLSRGNHTLNITTTIAGDGNASNNSKSILFFINGTEVNNTINTFENNTDALISFNQNASVAPVWQRGYSSKPTLNNSVSGNSQVYATSLSGVYPNNTTSYLVLPCYDLSQIPNPVLKFDMAFDLELDYDVLYMEYSINDGQSWNLLGSPSDIKWYNSNVSSCDNCVGGQWTGEAEKVNPNGGTNGTKRQYIKDLSAFGSASASPRSNILFRYVFKSDEAVNEDGAIIDNFSIESALSNKEVSFNGFKVYPNPIQNEIMISSSSASADPLQVSLFDLQGREIKKVNIPVSGSNHTIDVSAIPSGFYLIKITQGLLVSTTKIIKQ